MKTTGPAEFQGKHQLGVKASGEGLRRLFRTAVLTVLLLASFRTNFAGEELTAEISGLEERSSAIYCSCNDIEGLDLVFDLTLKNRGGQQRTVFVFVWASNDQVNPPERSLWPVKAIDSSLTEAGDLVVSDPARGERVDLKPGTAVKLSDIALLQPIGWYKGTRVRFERLRLLVLDATGRTWVDRIIGLAP